jgi:hypothetical protein
MSDLNQTPKPLVEIPLAIIIRHPGDVLVSQFTKKYEEETIGKPYATIGGSFNPLVHVNIQQALVRKLELQLGPNSMPFVVSLIASDLFRSKVAEEKIYYFLTTIKDTSSDFPSLQPNKYIKHFWVPIPELPKYGTHNNPKVREFLNAAFYTNMIQTNQQTP